MDEEPIIGPLVEQYKIVGNGVDRKVAFAMGLALLQAVQKNGPGFTANGMMQNAAEVVDITSDTEVDTVQNNGIKAKRKPIVLRTLQHQTKQLTTNNKSVTVKPGRQQTDEATADTSPDSVSSSKGLRASNGAAVRSSQTPPLLQSHTSVPRNSGFFSHLSQTLATGVGRLSLSTMSGSPTSTPVPKLMKRSREGSIEDDVVGNESRITQERPRKLSRVIKRPPIYDTIVSESESTRRWSVSSHRSDSRSSTSSGKIRQTRHSGLSVEFAPKHWNKRPELELRRGSPAEEFF
jgi:DNA (cytosine-5)-methyltransferase 1